MPLGALAQDGGAVVEHIDVSEKDWAVLAKEFFLS